MGCDGGTIPRRDELVRVKRKPEQKDKDSELSYRWRHCSITQQPLQEPIVACGLGRLYSKEAVIEGLLDRTILPESAQHIRSIKDVKDLKLTPNPTFKAEAEKGNEYVDRHTSPYICPVIGLEMNGKFRFVFVWGCGCVFSERALKEIKTTTCHKCEAAFVEDDVVILNGTDDDTDKMMANVETRQAKLKAEKKAKSEAKQKEKALRKEAILKEAQAFNPDKPGCSTEAPSGKIDEKPLHSKETLKRVTASTSSNRDLCKLNAESSKIHSRTMNGEKRSATERLNDPAFKKAKGSYSIASDPKSSEVFKSLFTSHKSHTKQDRAHWVTYNPFYN